MWVSKSCRLQTNLDEVREALVAGRTAEAAVHGVDVHVVLQQLQPLERLRTQEAGVGAALCVHQQVVLQRRVAHEALPAAVAGEGVGVAAVDPQVELQLVFVPEGLAAQRAFERPEALPDEEVLQRGILGGREQPEVSRSKTCRPEGSRPPDILQTSNILLFLLLSF